MGITKKQTTTITTRVLVARGSGKLKSSNDDNTLSDGRKGDPLHNPGLNVVRTTATTIKHNQRPLTPIELN